jgi:hypothetical protein
MITTMCSNKVYQSYLYFLLCLFGFICVDKITEILPCLIRNIWDKEEIPADWREEYLVKLSKKGDLHDYSNYR